MMRPPQPWWATPIACGITHGLPATSERARRHQGDAIQARAAAICDNHRRGHLANDEISPSSCIPSNNHLRHPCQQLHPFNNWLQIFHPSHCRSQPRGTVNEWSVGWASCCTSRRSSSTRQENGNFGLIQPPLLFHPQLKIYPLVESKYFTIKQIEFEGIYNNTQLRCGVGRVEV